MARANTPTLLSLDEYAAIIGIDPVHFNQVTIGDPIGDTGYPLDPATLPDMPMVQYSWQMDDRIGREEIAQAIASAEEQMMEWLGYALRPTWAYSKLVEVPRPNDVLLWNGTGLNPRGDWQTIKAGQGYFIAGGAERKDLVASGQSIVYSDANGDGYFETATVAVSTSVTEPSEIAVYYPGQFADDTFEIRPTKVTIDSNTGVATVTFRREQVVNLDLLETFHATAVEGLDDANFLTVVDVYRHWTDPSLQVQLEWHGGLCGWCNTIAGSNPGCGACTGGFGYGCLSPRDARLGRLAYSPGSWDATSNSWLSTPWQGWRQPDSLRLYFQHGWRAERPNVGALGLWQNRMDPSWARYVAAFATALLDRPLANKSTLRAFQGSMQEDLALNTSGDGGSSNYQNRGLVLDNPFGTKRGMVIAWGGVSDKRIGNAY
jgi:hypothetical protein